MPPHSKMPSLRNAIVVESAVLHLRKSDKRLRRVIDTVGPFTLKLQRDRFQMLVRSIVWQQISGKAATSIFNKLVAKLEGGKVTPDALAKLSAEEMRGAGISPQKLSYLQDLTARVLDGRVRLEKTARMSDAEVIAELTQIRGIGEWSAQMFLMFSLGRPDVFPHADLGIRSALRKLHELDDLPDRTLSHKLAEPWRPYATVASWYLWRSLDGITPT
jgi:DNA-3-methyladenine glycosylase II